jgi:hypothetical protein
MRKFRKLAAMLMAGAMAISVFATAASANPNNWSLRNNAPVPGGPTNPPQFRTDSAALLVDVNTTTIRSTCSSWLPSFLPNGAQSHAGYFARFIRHDGTIVRNNNEYFHYAAGSVNIPFNQTASPRSTFHVDYTLKNWSINANSGGNGNISRVN